MSGRAQPSYEFGPFLLDTAERRLLRERRPVPLTPKAYDVLLLLVRNSGHMLEKDELIRGVWPDAFVEEGNLSRHVSTLRKALGESHDGRGYIETIPRRGYRFIAHVRDLRDGRAGAEEKGAGPRPIDSLAVLPFVNASSDPDADYLSDGITESLINMLSRLPQLRVMARSTVSRYKGGDLDPQAAAGEMGVRAVLVGRLLQFRDDLIITAELVDAEDGSQLWGERYSRQRSDIFTIQEEISQKILKRLRLRLTDEQRRRLTKRHTVSEEAYQAYLMGRFLINKRTPDGLRKSLKHFERAIKLDRLYALPYVGLTESYIYLRDYSLLPLKDSLPKAREAALRAVRLNPALPEARIAMAHVKRCEWDWPGMEEEYRCVLKIDPSSAAAHKLYSVLLRYTGHHEESLAEVRKAQEIDPVSPNLIATAAANLYFARRYDQALREILKVIELEPTTPNGPFVAGWIYTQQGRYEEAIEAFRTAGRLFEYDNPEVAANLATAYALSGRTKEARQSLRQLRERSRREGAHSYYLALVYAALGDQDRAFTYLEKSYEERSPELGYLKADPLLDRLRPDARFTGLLRRVGLAV